MITVKSQISAYSTEPPTQLVCREAEGASAQHTDMHTHTQTRMQVACAEKHVLALCSWLLPPLQNAAFHPAHSSPYPDSSATTNPATAQGEGCGLRGGKAKRESGGSSSGGLSHSASDDEGGLFAFDGGASPRAFGSPTHPSREGGHTPPAHYSDLVEEGAAESGSQLPSLQTLAQRSVARHLVEPRSVLQVLVREAFRRGIKLSL